MTPLSLKLKNIYIKGEERPANYHVSRQENTVTIDRAITYTLVYRYRTIIYP